MRELHRDSWEQSPDAFRFQDALDPDRHGGGAVGNFVLLRATNHLRERMLENAEKFVRHFHFAPEKRLQTLDPFKVGNDHAARITKNVWNEKYFVPTFLKDQIRSGRSRAVGAFRQNPAFQLRGVLLRDHAIDRRGHEHIARHDEHLVWVDAIALIKGLQVALLDHVLLGRFHVDALWIVKRDGRVTDADDFNAGF